MLRLDKVIKSWKVAANKGCLLTVWGVRPCVSCRR